MKINCPTSMTNPAAIAPLLDVINQYGSLKSTEARNSIFPKARAAISRWNEDKPDTHSEGQLFQYGLIEYVSGSTEKEFSLSFLGKRFLEIFEKKDGQINANGEKEKDKYVCKAGMDFAYNAVLIDCLLTWKISIGENTLHPGLLLLKLMVDSRLDGYIFENEWAYVCNSDFADTLDYESLVNEIVSYRDAHQEPPVESSSNTYAFLIAFANSWQIFEKTVVDSKNKFVLTETTESNLKAKMLEIDTLIKEDDGVISENAAKTRELDLVYKTEVDTGYERNRIIFGAPGTGKSFNLKRDCDNSLKDTSGSYERVTFHPDYTYSQFVGTYKPVSDGAVIRYEFVPGPFMRVFVDAMKSARSKSPQPHILIIEEINRAKVAAVFGEVFQLLDRDDDGVSEYEIQTSEDVRKYISAELGCDRDKCKKIKIPNNMYIWASMNSADQGVFPMDTAFKRRWSFEYLGINKNQDKIKGRVTVGDTSAQKIEWNILRCAINEKLAKEYKVNEDKLMGPFFISKRVLKTVSAEDDTLADRERFIEVFKSKVIMYLYEDAAKQHKHKLFAGCDDTTKYSAVCDSFDKIGMRIFGENFEEVYYNPQKG